MPKINRPVQRAKQTWQAAPPALQPAMLRSQVIAATQSFFRHQGFWEVTPPVFNAAIPAEMHLYPFASTWHPQSGNQQLWMTTSPERSLKIMLARGLAPNFAIGKSMRNMEGAGSRHNPEFLMLEWYRRDATFRDIMDDVRAYVRAVTLDILGEVPQSLSYHNQTIPFDTDWQEISLADEFQQRLHVDLQQLCQGDALYEFARHHDYYTEHSTWNEIFDQIVLNELESHWPTSPFFLLDFPTRMSPLCTPQKKRPWLAERFEFYVGGMELANGNTEYTNSAAIREEFERVNANRAARNLPTSPIDEDFLQALERMNDASYAGIGFGIDRFAMLLANVTDIRLVEPFGLQATLLPPEN